MKARVALAVAIIKNKPSGLTGRQYAEALACKLKKQDEGWKRRSRELQQEVLRLRQELLITRVTPKGSTEEASKSLQILFKKNNCTINLLQATVLH